MSYCNGSVELEHSSLLQNVCQPAVGYETFVFMSLINVVVKCMCSIADPNRRVVPPESPTSAVFRDNEYDFIIVGGGAAGQTKKFLFDLPIF